MKIIKHVWITALVFFLFSGLGSAVLPDKKGCTDHPVFPKRMSEYSIENCETKDFGAFNFETGQKDKTSIEGRMTKLTYRIEDRSKEASGLAVVQNYENAIKSVQGTVLFIDKNSNRSVNGKIIKDGKEIWAQVEKGNGKIWLTIVEKAGMAQNMMSKADAFGNDLKSTGQAAVPGISAGYAVIAAENTAISAFKDPYNGGIKLPNGGGEPGKAYMAFINAAYKKDHTQMCKLMAETADMDACLQQKEAMDWYIAMFTHPKSHNVLGGFMKGEEATLNVAYTFASAPQSTGFVVMKQMKGKWGISSFGGSGSGSVSAEASGQVDLGSSSASGSASIDGEVKEFALIDISASRQQYTGKCPVDIAFTAYLTFRGFAPDNISYHWERGDGSKTPDRMVKPPRTGHMSIKEAWKGGKPGEEQDVSMRFVVESGGKLIIKDPPSVKVICK
ncbi:MAG: hypothetical protein ACD_87C00248G0002 [uncultured bacterium]|nr:MAG: hypothetical protein ACD_87C00248G0002 [uncultured bacterium]